MKRLRAGRYELLRRLGAGSIGVVFEAIDHRDGQRVAVKQLRPLVPAGAYRLQREFDVLRGLRHPNVVQYFELYTDENPAFITMELIEGQDFVSYVRRRMGVRRAVPRAITDSPIISEAPALPAFSEQVDQDRLRATLQQLVPAVQAIHAAGVIHRDLKPSNVLVEGDGRVVVMDFSIATEARSYADEATSGGVMIGTPEYMAPEQAAGETETSAADWYALGAMMYVAMTGRVPFEGSWNQVVEDKQAYDPPSAAAFVDGAPDDLVKLCSALLSRHPEKRPNALEICHHLDIAGGDRGPDGEPKWVGLVPPFVARDAELTGLQDLFRDVLGYGADDPEKGACALISGGPGMGKTRLLDEFINRATVACPVTPLVFRGLCHPDDPRCYNAFEQVARQLSQRLQGFDKAALRDLLPADRGLLPRMFSTFLRVAGIERGPRLVDTNLAQMRLRAIDALFALLLGLARRQPVVIAIDNIQWADRDSIALLRDLFEIEVPARVALLLVGRRPSDAEAPPLTRDDPNDAAETVEHGPDHSVGWAALQSLADRDLALTELAPAEQDELFRQMSGKPQQSDEVPGPRIGIPLLLLERIQRVLAARSGDSASTDPAPLIDLFGQQIDRLPRAARTLLQAVAIMGSPAPLSALAKAVDQSIADRGKALDALRTAGLVREEREGREPWLWAAHDEIRAATIRGLPKARTRELHLRLAMALQRAGNTRDTVMAARWRAAGDLERAFAFQERAAKAARDRFAFHRAADTYGRALDAVHPDSALAARLTRARAQSAFCAQRYPEAASDYQRALAIGRDITLDLYWRAADCTLRAGDIDSALPLIRAHCARLGAEKLARQPGKRTGRWSKRAREALASRRSRPRDEAEIAAVELQRTDGLQNMTLALIGLAPTFGSNLQSEHLLATLKHGEKVRVARARSCELLYTVTRSGDVGAAEYQRAERALVDARAGNDTYGLALAELCMALLDFLQSSLARAAAGLERAIDGFISHCPDSDWELAIARYWQFMTAVERGRIDVYARSVARATTSARLAGDNARWTIYGALPDTWRLLWSDLVDADPERLPTDEEIWSSDWAYLMRAMNHLGRAMSHAYMHRPEPADQALRAYNRALGKHRGQHGLWFGALAACLRARVALMRADHSSASKLAKQLSQMDFRLADGHAELIWAALAWRAGERANSERYLQRANERFTTRGAQAYAMGTIFRSAEFVDEARALVLRDEVRNWCAIRGIGNPQRMFDYLCPWSLGAASGSPTTIATSAGLTGGARQTEDT